ncbi:MAG: hypothetical protein HY316_03685 [Acidobacteria bacterium]|nr:hypothetical protein [Acidobacteriota bacterium]
MLFRTSRTPLTSTGFTANATDYTPRFACASLSLRPSQARDCAWADGTAERDAALLLAWKTTAKMPRTRRVTLGGDKNYDTGDFVSTLREMHLTQHVAQNNTRRSSAIDGRTTRHASDALSQRKTRLSLSLIPENRLHSRRISSCFALATQPMQSLL